ncbi:MAG: hypothetical protein K8T90_21940 [Planctomycetes bacterium]|nr:hypothetical protein [Planctomycetota bacterium]
MTLFENGKLILARLFASPTETAPPDDGTAVSDERRQAERLRRATEARRALDREIQQAERRRRAELPVLREKVNQAEADVASVRKVLEATEAAYYDARREQADLDDSLRRQIDRARIELERTAWPWLAVAIEAAQERISRFTSYERGQLQTWRSEAVRVAPDPSDPDFRSMLVRGVTYRMDRVATNDAALDAVKAEMDRALKALRSLPWRVEEPTDEEVQALLAMFEDTVWKKAAETLVWKEPSPPKYDANGNRIAA